MLCYGIVQYWSSPDQLVGQLSSQLCRMVGDVAAPLSPRAPIGTVGAILRANTLKHHIPEQPSITSFGVRRRVIRPCRR